METKSNQYINLISDEQLLVIVRGVVGKYVHSKAIPQREFEDVVMSIVEKFLNQKGKIFCSFEGKSKITTYCIAVVNRMCCEVIRKESKQWYLVSEREQQYSNDMNTSTLEAEKNLIFKQEIKRLENLMLFFNDEKAKLTFFLKVYFSIPVNRADIKSYAKGKENEVELILNSENLKSKGDLFASLAGIVNLVENKNIGGDAVRIWFTNQVNSIIKRLNGDGIANHDKESLSILLEMLYNDNKQGVEIRQLLVLMILFGGSLC